MGDDPHNQHPKNTDTSLSFEEYGPRQGNDATFESFFLETCIYLWRNLPAIPPNRSDEQNRKQ